MVKGKKVAPAPKAGVTTSVKKDSTKKDFKSAHSHLFVKDARDFRIGRDIQPRRDLSRFVRWPRYVRLQRQRAILKLRLKVPPAINQFSKALDKTQASNLFRTLSHYRPETREEKMKRLTEQAKSEVKGDAKKSGVKPLYVKYGLNHITTLVEQKKAKLVVIAHDVDPIELVVWLPSLCRKMDVPYCIVKSKARLGALIHKKTATALAITEVRKEDQPKLEQIVAAVKPLYNDNVSDLKKWGGGIMGVKSQAVTRKRERAAAREASKAIKPV
jgi:large subunit ribosomal protein L7Ae